jgi:Putative transposase of IS4/5 family (DUF4096)
MTDALTVDVWSHHRELKKSIRVVHTRPNRHQLEVGATAEFFRIDLVLGRCSGRRLFHDRGARAMDVCSFASDLTDAEWALLEPLVPRSHPAGRRQTYQVRQIINAIFYLLRTSA